MKLIFHQEYIGTTMIGNTIHTLIYSVISRLWMIVQATLCSGAQVKDVEYDGFDVFYFYTHMFRNYFSGYPWQVKTSYGIIVGCIISMLIVFSLFTHDLVKRNHIKRKERKIHEKYHDAFSSILGNLPMSASEMEQVLGTEETKLRKIHPKYFVSLLAKVRMEMYEVVYLPNLQPLANLIGVREYMELNLLQRRDVFQTLQILLLFQLVISEGRLANYVNSSEPDIRMLARLCYILCSENEPYRYLKEDLDAPQSLMRPMLLHYVFGWMKEQNKRMPNFLLLSEQIKTESMSAFLIREVAYWGTDEEKAAMPLYFNSEKLECRSAAIGVVTVLSDARAEDDLVASYERQPEIIRRESLKAILAIKSGRSLDFLVEVYKASNSRDTKEIALSCIYIYSNAGRRKFEQLRGEANEEERVLIDQVDSNNLLSQIRTFSFN